MKVFLLSIFLFIISLLQVEVYAQKYVSPLQPVHTGSKSINEEDFKG